MAARPGSSARALPAGPPRPGTATGRTVRRAGAEGTGPYGAALARCLASEAVTVIEVSRGDAAGRRCQGKAGAIDAEAAARAVLSGRARAIARTADGPAETVRILRMARSSALKARTRAVSQLRAVLIRADPALRESLAGPGSAALIRACAGPGQDSTATPAAAIALALPARRIQALSTGITRLRGHITAAVTAAAPRLPAPAPARHRRRPAHRRRRQPGPAHQRGRLRRAARRQSRPGLIRQDPPAPPQPRP